MGETLGLACLAAPGRPAREALLLARSLRAFGGAEASCPLWVLVLDGAERLAGPERRALLEAGVRLAGFELPDEAAGFPFAAKVHAAAAAEALAGSEVEWLAWLDADALVLGDLGPLRPGPAHTLGCRPVDHTLIGSLWDEPPDPFWTAIYAACGVPEDRLFPMTASVDGRRLRPYFNAGLLVVRPARGLLQAWPDAFARLFRQAEFAPFYTQDALYRLFFHQAVLAGVILARLDSQAIALLPREVNYPLHMHAQTPPAQRAPTLSDLVTARYDTLFDDPGWSAILPNDEPRRGWLAAHVPLLAGDAPIQA
jgi:hypothetical protein